MGEHSKPGSGEPTKEKILAFAGTQKDADKKSKEVQAHPDVRTGTVSWSEENVPTVKADLLAWLNKHTHLG